MIFFSLFLNKFSCERICLNSSDFTRENFIKIYIIDCVDLNLNFNVLRSKIYI